MRAKRCNAPPRPGPQNEAKARPEGAPGASAVGKPSSVLMGMRSSTCGTEGRVRVVRVWVRSQES